MGLNSDLETLMKWNFNSVCKINTASGRTVGFQTKQRASQIPRGIKNVLSYVINILPFPPTLLTPSKVFC